MTTARPIWGAGRLASGGRRNDLRSPVWPTEPRFLGERGKPRSRWEPDAAGDAIAATGRLASRWGSEADYQPASRL